MTSKLVVNTIESDTGISSVSFASSISMNSTAKFHFSAAGIDIGADTNINRPAAGVLGFNVNGTEKVRIDTNGHIHGVGVVTATHFFGDGSNLTGIDTDLVSDTSPQLGGNLDCNNKNISLNDSTGGTNNRIKIGTNDDLQLWHNASTGNSNVSNYNGDLYIQGNNGSGTGVNQIAIKSNAAVELNYQGTKKFETSSSGVTVTGTCSATSFSGDGSNLTGLSTPLSFRNKIINGSQQIFQRGTSDERYGGNDGYYNGIADRWAIRMHSSVAQTTFSKDTSDTPDGFGSCQKSVRSNAGSSNAGKYYVYDTKLEGQDLQDFAKGTSSAKEFTLSFYVKTGVSGVYCVEMRDLDHTRMVGGTYTVSNGNWNRYIITFPADTTGAFGNDNGASLWVRFWLAAGSNFTSGTARTAWASGAPDSVLAVGQTAQVGDNVADTWRITGIQLEVGSTATAFEHRSYADEFRRCARYCYQWIDDQQLGFGQVYSGSGYIKIFPPIPVNMRAKPSVTKNAPTGYWFVSYHGNSGYAGDRNVSVEGNSGDDNLQSANSFRIFVHGGSNQGNAVTCWCLIHDTAGAYLRLEAEL